MKYLALLIALLTFGCVGLAQNSPTTLHLAKNIPLGDAIIFVAPAVGGQSYGFFMAPDGTAAAVPVEETRQAFEAGYRPVTFGDVLIGLQEQQKKIDRLTAINAAFQNTFVEQGRAAAAPTPQPAAQVDQAQTMRLMLFQSLLSRTVPPPPVRVEVTNCSAFPALCIHK
jgi:hypothetical protein